MALQLSDYQTILDTLDDSTHEVLEAHWHDASRLFSPRGLDIYFQGIAGLNSLGRGNELVDAFVQAAPLLVREIGEEAVAELLSAAIKMYSRTSAAVLVLLITTAPTAATRLGELSLFKDYLSLLNTLLAQAPRSLRPMLNKLDVIMGHLTLGGLRRWAMWGVSAYRNKLDDQAAYFGLENEDSLSILKKEQRGVLFIDVQRRLIMYLRALWGRDFFLRPTSGDFESRTGYRPYIEHYFIHLPDAFDDVKRAEVAEDDRPISGVEIYRAAAAHAAAHIHFSRYDPLSDQLSPLQKLFIGLIEDARIEALAIREFPGLRQIWHPLLSPQIASVEHRSDLSLLLDQMVHVLADPEQHYSHPLIKSASTWFTQAADRLNDDRMAWELGSRLAAEAEGLGLGFNANKDLPTCIYRDDNRYLWQAQTEAQDDKSLTGPVKQERKYVSLIDMVFGLDVEFAGDDAQEIWVLGTEFYEDDGSTLNEKEGKPPMASPVYYPEWDYQTQLERPDWTTVLEKRPKLGDRETVDATIEHNRPVIQRLKYLIEAVQPQGVVRQRKQEDGDTIDINAAVDAMISIRMGGQPDPRINIRTQLQIRDLSVLLLIDLSESTNDPVRDAEDGITVLDMARDAAALLAEALHKVGDPFAIHGFESNGRHEVNYYRLKDFDAPYNETTKARLAGMTGQLSTRMGAALRRAGSLLAQRSSQKKLVLLLTDGEPADNDVRDPQYLRFDTKKAVEGLKREGIMTFCLSLDPYADQYVSNIFGPKNYMVLDNVARLPEKLPALYLSLTR